MANTKEILAYANQAVKRVETEGYSVFTACDICLPSFITMATYRRVVAKAVEIIDDKARAQTKEIKV